MIVYPLGNYFITILFFVVAMFTDNLTAGHSVGQLNMLSFSEACVYIVVVVL